MNNSQRASGVVLSSRKHILNVLGQVIRGLSGCAQTEFDSPVYTLTSTGAAGT